MHLSFSRSVSPSLSPARATRLCESEISTLLQFSLSADPDVAWSACFCRSSDTRHRMLIRGRKCGSGTGHSSGTCPQRTWPPLRQVFRGVAARDDLQCIPGRAGRKPSPGNWSAGLSRGRVTDRHAWRSAIHQTAAVWPFCFSLCRPYVRDDPLSRSVAHYYFFGGATLVESRALNSREAQMKPTAMLSAEYIGPIMERITIRSSLLFRALGESKPPHESGAILRGKQETHR